MPVDGETLKWPIAKGDEAGYQSRRNLLMYFHWPQTGDHAVSLEAVGHKIGFIRSTHDAFKDLLLSKTKGHYTFKPADYVDLSLNSSQWWITLPTWGTSEWVFYPDGTAIAHERPRKDRRHQVVPW